MLLPKRKKRRSIIFVCTGNTCRSPMAQGILQDYLEKAEIKHIDVKTAGVMTIPGLLPSPDAVQVMNAAEVDITKHRSAPLTPEMLRKADLVLGMTPFHVQFALRMDDSARDKTFLLKEYAKSDLKNYQITDPMGATLEVYKRVYREIKLAVEKLCEMDIIHAPLDARIEHKKWEGELMGKQPAAEPEPAPAKAPARKRAKPAAKKKPAAKA